MQLEDLTLLQREQGQRVLSLLSSLLFWQAF
jgi:hypothetical protein